MLRRVPAFASRRWLKLGCAVLALAAVVMGAAWYARGGHVIAGQFVLNHGGRDFDVARPPGEAPCPAAPRPACGADDVCVRYLGAGGLYLEWRGGALLAGPFFSNQSVLRAGFGTLTSDDAAIRHGLEGVPVEKVLAVFAGHSHYDHIGDIPTVARDYTPHARLLLNASARAALHPYPGLEARVELFDGSAPGPGRWIEVRSADGRPLFRLLPIASRHAPHFDHYTWGKGAITAPWTAPWQEHRVADLKDGGTWAFLIDLLDPANGKPRFRVYYQDSASDIGLGWPGADGPQAEHDVDLAVLCVASHQYVRAAPEWLLEAPGRTTCCWRTGRTSSARGAIRCASCRCSATAWWTPTSPACAGR